MFYLPCSLLLTFEAGGGGSQREKIEIVDIWEIKNMQIYYQLVIASLSVDMSEDMSADLSFWSCLQVSNWLLI